MRHAGQENRLELLAGYLGFNLLTHLLSVSHTRLLEFFHTPEFLGRDVNRRIDFIYRIVRVLLGAYNGDGVKAWFVRPRTQLQGRRPVDAFVRGWKITDPGPQAVIALARSINA